MATEYIQPTEGFKALAAITDIYTSTLKLVYPAARDIARELDGYATEFTANAKARIDGLIVKVQNLNWEKQKLQAEAEEARVAIAEAVGTIHTFLRGNGLEDLRGYKANEENDSVPPSAGDSPPVDANPSADEGADE
ncbi:hypothetical protein F5144DRAFT_163313 [Chaetomium tenue]|uniref:Uncharacterized protein n=1 Tax=Chaetomium tenue TaxID=1854479 RepID=A0ACB7PDF0_9PEZI|nr:hypothetical protein F5144DRAFT_163313 [Chaetomium globosum]